MLGVISYMKLLHSGIIRWNDMRFEILYLKIVIYITSPIRYTPES